MVTKTVKLQLSESIKVLNNFYHRFIQENICILGPHEVNMIESLVRHHDAGNESGKLSSQSVNIFWSCHPVIVSPVEDHWHLNLGQCVVRRNCVTIHLVVGVFISIVKVTEPLRIDALQMYKCRKILKFSNFEPGQSVVKF